MENAADLIQFNNLKATLKPKGLNFFRNSPSIKIVPVKRVILRIILWVALAYSLTSITAGITLWSYHINLIQPITSAKIHLPIFLYGMASIFSLGLIIAVWHSKFFQLLYQKSGKLALKFLPLFFKAIYRGTFRRSRQEKWGFLSFISILIIIAIAIQKGGITITLKPLSIFIMLTLVFNVFIMLALLYNLRTYLRHYPLLKKLGIKINKTSWTTLSHIIILLACSASALILLLDLTKSSTILPQYIKIPILLGTALLIIYFTLYFYSKKDSEILNIGMFYKENNEIKIFPLAQRLECYKGTSQQLQKDIEKSTKPRNPLAPIAKKIKNSPIGATIQKGFQWMKNRFTKNNSEKEEVLNQDIEKELTPIKDFFANVGKKIKNSTLGWTVRSGYDEVKNFFTNNTSELKEGPKTITSVLVPKAFSQVKPKNLDKNAIKDNNNNPTLFQILTSIKESDQIPDSEKTLCIGLKN